VAHGALADFRVLKIACAYLACFVSRSITLTCPPGSGPRNKW
jgi:hypothetical protein